VLTQRNLRQVLRYAVVSGLSAAITLGVPIVLHEAAGLGEEAAVAIALAAAFVVNFALFRAYVFATEGGMADQLVRFALVRLAMRGGEYVFFLLLHTLFGLYYVLALLVVLAVSTVVKFLVDRTLVFRDSEPLRRAVPGAEAR